MNRDPYRSAISQGIIRVLIEAGHESGSPVAMLDATVAADELLTALAFVIHSSPDCASPSGRRQAAERLAKSLRVRVAEVQALAADGRLPFVETRGAVQ